MNKYKNTVAIAVLSLLLTNNVLANEETADRFSFDLQMGEEGSLNPETFVPLYWDDNWFSGVGFTNSTQLTQGTVPGFTDSKLGTSISKRVLRLNLISHQTNNDGYSYSIGGDYQMMTIDKTEFGYFYLNNGLIDDYVAFDNSIEIEMSGLSLRGDFTLGQSSDKHLYRLSTIVSPGSTLNVDQDTSFTPIIPTSGVGTSSKSQALSYMLQFETRHRLSEFFSVGLNLQYEVLPLEYDLQVLSATATSFQDATIDNTEITTRVGLRFVFNYPLVDGLFPVLGVTSEDVEVEDNLNGGSVSESQTLISVGFTGSF